MSRNITFLVVERPGCEAQKVVADAMTATHGEFSFWSDCALVAKFPMLISVTVDSVEPVPACEVPASAVTALGAVDFPPSVSIGAINITGGTPEDIRAICAEFMAALKESGPIR